MKILVLSFAITATIFVLGSILFNAILVVIKKCALHLHEKTLQRERRIDYEEV